MGATENLAEELSRSSYPEARLAAVRLVARVELANRRAVLRSMVLGETDPRIREEAVRAALVDRLLARELVDELDREGSPHAGELATRMLLQRGAVSELPPRHRRRALRLAAKEQLRGAWIDVTVLAARGFVWGIAVGAVMLYALAQLGPEVLNLRIRRVDYLIAAAALALSCWVRAVFVRGHVGLLRLEDGMWWRRLDGWSPVIHGAFLAACLFRVRTSRSPLFTPLYDELVLCVALAALTGIVINLATSLLCTGLGRLRNAFAVLLLASGLPVLLPILLLRFAIDDHVALRVALGVVGIPVAASLNAGHARVSLELPLVPWLERLRLTRGLAVVLTAASTVAVASLIEPGTVAWRPRGVVLSSDRAMPALDGSGGIAHWFEFRSDAPRVISLSRSSNPVFVPRGSSSVSARDYTGDPIRLNDACRFASDITCVRLEATRHAHGWQITVPGHENHIIQFLVVGDRRTLSADVDSAAIPIAIRTKASDERANFVGAPKVMDDGFTALITTDAPVDSLELFVQYVPRER